MRRIFWFIFALSVVIFTSIACSKSGGGTDVPDSCATVEKSWSANVNPIIQTYCNQPACHDAASSNGPGPLTNYAQVYAARTLVKDQVASGLMPQNTTLTTAQKQSIICWINNGAPNN